MPGERRLGRAVGPHIQCPQPVKTANPERVAIQQQRPYLRGCIALGDLDSHSMTRSLVNVIQALLGTHVHIAVGVGRKGIDIVLWKRGPWP
jgi:hypothetical protein